jgi:hypothetical protein
MLKLAFVILPLLSITSSAWSAIDWSQAKEDASAASLCAESTPAVVTETTQPVDPRAAAYDQYYVEALRHRSAVFAWQASASKFVFGMVMILVLSGLVFSAVQFYISMHRGTDGASNEVELSMQSVKVRSQFLGVVTLAMSLAFFYLYVSRVYPIITVADVSTQSPNKPMP